MSKILAYIRTSTDKQDLNNQRLEILEYARRHDLKIADFIEISMSSRKSARARRIEELLSYLEAGDTLIVTELSRLGRSTGAVIRLFNELIANGITLVVLKQNLNVNKDNQDITTKIIITMLALFAEMERDIISQRTKEALAAKKAQGITLGKPKGTTQASIYDKDRRRITELLGLGVPARRIAEQHLDYGSPSSLSYYINTRKLNAATNGHVKEV